MVALRASATLGRASPRRRTRAASQRGRARAHERQHRLGTHDRSTDRLRLIGESGLILLAALISVYRAVERDFWFHLAAGRSIVEHGIPIREGWCLAALGQWPWLGEWLYHVALYLVRATAGDVGVALWRAAWSAIAMGLALALARTLGARFMATAAVSLLVLTVARGRMVARPEQLTLAFVLLFVLVFERALRSRGDRALWLVPAGALWANLHPAWILGPGIAGLYAVFELGRDRARALRWIGIAAALFAAAAITPRPLDTLSLEVLHDIGADPMVGMITELRSWNWPQDRTHPFTALAALAVAAAALGGRRVWRASPALAVMAIAGLAAGLLYARFRPLGGFVALPALALALDPSPPGPAPGTRAAPGERPMAGRLRLSLAVLAGLAGIAWLALDTKLYPPGAKPHDDSVPVYAVALADSLGLDGPVLNTSYYGGYILWIRGERHLPLQDTRNLGSAALRSRLVRARVDPAALDTLLAEWDFTHAILEPPMSEHDRLAGLLMRHPDWALVFADDAGLLFVRRDLHPEIARARGYAWMSPDYGDMAQVASLAVQDSSVARTLGAELERALAGSPLNARASLWLGLLALARGDARDALSHLDRVERLAPAMPGVALRRGLAYEMLGDAAGAARAYRRALRDTSDAAAARAALQRLAP